MRIRIFITTVLLFLSFQYSANAQNSDEIFTIYLVRHAEKEVSAENPRNPPLTECGQERAEKLALFFEEVDLNAIYSSDYTRTKSTARPTARAKGIDVDLYNPGELGDIARTLIEQKKDALVVGHSNTTGVLAGILAGEEIASFDESIYNRIYQVVINKTSRQLNVFHTSFSCSGSVKLKN